MANSNMDGSSNVEEFIFEGPEEYCSFRSSQSQNGCSYAIRSSRKTKAESYWVISEFNTGHTGQQGVNIPFFNYPFIKQEKTIFDCSNGRKYYKTKSDFEQEDHPSAKKKRFCLQETKKLGCPAQMTVVKILYFPEYIISDKKEKERVLLQIKRKLKSEGLESVKTVERYYVVVSKPSVHSHPTATCFLNQQIDNSLKQVIKKHVSDGITNVNTIKVLLRTYVKDNISETITGFSRAFFPTNKIIYNYITKFIFETKQSKIDQVALVARVNSWEKTFGGTFFYRPLCAEKSENFLFCYQAPWQKDLLARYGEIVLLDATYKTSKYALPLFSLVVKTNNSFIVVGIFLIQREDSNSIAEALQMFKTWNRDWTPTYFLVDYCEAEINAIKTTFNCLAYICDFHREQAWERWLKKKDNVANKDDAQKLLKMWRQLATSSADVEFDDLLSTFKLSDTWTNNKKAINYFSNTWLPVKKMWTRAFFLPEFLFIITTNNGIENQNRIIKHCYLFPHADKSLCGVLDILITQFLPDSLKKYQIDNSKLSSTYKNYNINIPNFLLNRPLFFIKHVYERYATASNVYSTNKNILIADTHVFYVKSETERGKQHIVDFSVPSCTCIDFQKHRFPCKHFCAIFINIADHPFESLPEKYLNSPYFTIDPKYSLFEESFSNPGKNINYETASGCEANNEPHVSSVEQNVNTTHGQDLTKAKELIKCLYDKSFLMNSSNTNALHSLVNILTQSIELIDDCIETEDNHPLLPVSDLPKGKRKRDI